MLQTGTYQFIFPGFKGRGYGAATTSYQLTKYDGEFRASTPSGFSNTAYLDFNNNGTKGRLFWDADLDGKIAGNEKKPIANFKIKKVRLTTLPVETLIIRGCGATYGNLTLHPEGQALAFQARVRP